MASDVSGSASTANTGAPALYGDTAGAPSVAIDYLAPGPVSVRTATVEQLRALRDGKRDIMAEVAWAAVGVALGAFPTGFPTLTKFLRGSATVTQTEMAHVALFLLGTVTFVVALLVVWTRGKRAGDIFEEIVNPGGKK